MRSPFKVQTLFALVVLFSYGLLQGAPPERMPQLQTQEQKLKFLLYLNKHIPSLFHDAMTYDIDLFETLDKQVEIFKALQKQKTYGTLQQARPERAEITIKPASASNQSGPDPLKLERLRSKLPAVKNPSETRSQVLARLPEVSRFNPNGFITGLIKTLPPQKQGELFKMELNQKIETLRRELPEELVSHGFNAAHYGLPESRLSREEALERLNAILKAEHDVQLTATAAVLHQASDEQMGSLLEKNKLEEKVSSTFPLPDKKQAAYLTQLIHAQLKEIKAESSEASTPRKPARTLTLKEVAPQVGIFRGCVGGDCSSQFSFPYPNSPNEHVFFVHGADGEVKGYVSATRVLSGKHQTPALYVHTIAGARISAEDTESILQGLHQVKEKLGTHEVLLGTDENIGRIVNYEPIKNTMYQAVEKSPQNKIRYPDQALRKPMKTYDQGTYDHPDQNRTARVYHPQPDRKLSLQTGYQMIELPPMGDVPIDRNESLKIALLLEQAGRNSSAQAVFQALGKNEKNLSDLHEAFTNPDSEPVQVYLEKLSAKIRQAGGQPDDWIKSSPELFLQGYLSSKDSLAPAQLEKTKAFLATLRLEQEKSAKALLGVLEHRSLNGIQPVGASQLLDYLLEKNKAASDQVAARILAEVPEKTLKKPQFQGYLDALLKRGNAHEIILNEVVLLQPKWIDEVALYNQVLDQKTHDEAVVTALSMNEFKAAKKDPGILEKIVSNGKALPAFTEAYFAADDHYYGTARKTKASDVQLLKRIADTGLADAQVIEAMSSSNLSKAPEALEIFKQIAGRGNAEVELLTLIQEKPWKDQPEAIELLRKVAKKGTTDDLVAEFLLSNPKNKAFSKEERLDILRKIIRRGKADENLLRGLFDSEENTKTKIFTPEELRQTMETLIKRGNVDYQIVFTLGQQPWVNDPQITSYLETLMKRKGIDDSFVRVLAPGHPWWHLPKLRQWLFEIADRKGADWSMLDLLHSRPSEISWEDTFALLKKISKHESYMRSKVLQILESEQFIQRPESVELVLEMLQEKLISPEDVLAFAKNPGLAKNPKASLLMEGLGNKTTEKPLRRANCPQLFDLQP